MADPDLATQLDFRTIFNASPNAYALLSPSLAFIDVNSAYLRTTGRKREELIGRDVFEAFPALTDLSDIKLLRASFERVLTERRPDSQALLRYPIASAVQGEAEDRYWSATNTPVFDDHGDVAMILHHTADITELQRIRLRMADAEPVSPAEDLHKYVFGRAKDMQQANEALLAERAHLHRLFEQAPGFVCVLRGPEHVFELANAAYYQLTGQQDLLGRKVREALPELEGQGFYELLDQVYSTGEPFVGRAMRLCLRHRPEASHSGEVYIDFVYQPITEPGGNVSGIFVQGNDVSAAHRLAREVSHQARHDALTGLVNRREFEQQLKKAIQEAQQQSEAEHSLLYFDLDQFKMVNDTCGHEAGDELLRQLSDQLNEWAPPGSVLARLGGDEFGLLLKEGSGRYARDIAEGLRKLASGLEFRWGKLRFGSPVSIGVVTFGRGFTFQEVLSTADSACFLAKEKGRNRVHIYRPDDDELSSRLREMGWIGRLREALQEERLVLYAQRIVPIRGDGGQERREVLIRLQEPDGSIVPPMAFIPAAERYNLMPQIDRYVVDKVFRYIERLPAGERDRMTLSVNLSGATLDDDDFLPFIHQKLAQYAVSPARICLEITETTAVANLKQTAQLIHALRELGFRFALDDFGSGMSSFGYLKHLPVSFLKIDGVFIKDIVDDRVDRAMVEAIAHVASVMGIQTIAEYVENDRILAQLDSLGVDFAQGYGVHRPEPLEALSPSD